MIETLDATIPLAVFEHAKKREWGLGIMLWEDEKKRGYLFENGQLRILAEEFYSLMREVDRPEEEVRALFNALKPELDAARRQAAVEHRSPAQRRAARTMTFEDQLARFRAEYPDGFQDPKWNETKRGVGARKRQRRHRDPSIERARSELSSETLREAIAQGRHGSVIERAWTIMRQTDLVSAAELARPPSEVRGNHAAFATALAELLHGESAYVVRFDHFVSAFRQTFQRSPGWQVATLLPAIVHPTVHVCVHPTSFRSQAKWMAPRLLLPRLPTGASYGRCQAMADLVASRLRAEAECPRDLLDVHDFIRATTGPASKQQASALDEARQVAESKPCPKNKD